MRYFVIAGEASGDLHGSFLVEQIRNTDHEATIEGWGGDLMAAQGVKLHKHIRDLAFMGFVEVAKNLPTIFSNIKLVKQQISTFKPDALVLVDYPGFNFRIAKWAKKSGFKVLYFISPNVWAWKANRVYKVRDNTDRMYTILPFEKAFYAKYGIDVEYFGHPLVDVVASYKAKSLDEFRQTHNLPDKPIIATMAGSRKQEISRMLPIMLKTAKKFPQYEFLITGAPAIDKDFYGQFLTAKPENVELLFNSTYEILTHAEAGLVTSGTATLEAALFGVPQVVCYKADAFSVFIARQVSRFSGVKYISLVNLILDKPSVRELIQDDLTTQNASEELGLIIKGGAKRTAIETDYAELYGKLGENGVYKRIAEDIIHRTSKI
ncbi:MAG: lipid-A-disaccharide synthase [Bacteroidales bacterium]|jgi:lipid-A-disaccharide synthase|nr:lipid-A-disaccharide synthase [Bacteroidales bacterium]